jgi:uncharacterized membrane protein YadS
VLYGFTAYLKANSRGLALHEILPWFILGFLGLIVLRSLGLIPGASLPILTRLTTLLTTIAMAALGFGVDVRVIAQAGIRVRLAVTTSLIALGSMSYALIVLSRVA